MEARTNKVVTCIFCGQDRNVTYIEDDGRDYEGHQRGSFRSRTIDKGCTCALGKIEHNKAKITKMCMNCDFYNGVYCANQETIAKISSFFEVGTRVAVKHPTKKCSNWKLKLDILERLIMDGE